MVKIKIDSIHEGSGQSFTVAHERVFTNVWVKTADGDVRVDPMTIIANAAVAANEMKEPE